MIKHTLLGDSLLVHPAEQNGPRDSSGVLALSEERSALRGDESEDLGVSTDEELALLACVR